MDAVTLVSEEEYLHTSYQPDREYEDGTLIERNVGTRSHSNVQMLIAGYFHARRKQWNIHAYPEIRFRIRPDKYLIPDIAIVQNPQPSDEVLTAPPLLWIEILSPEDRHLRVNRKVKEVLDFGAPYVWVIDPISLESELHSADGMQPLDGGILRIPGTPIEVPLLEALED